MCDCLKKLQFFDFIPQWERWGTHFPHVEFRVKRMYSDNNKSFNDYADLR